MIALGPRDILAAVLTTVIALGLFNLIDRIIYGLAVQAAFAGSGWQP